MSVKESRERPVSDIKSSLLKAHDDRAARPSERHLEFIQSSPIDVQVSFGDLKTKDNFGEKKLSDRDR